MRTDKVLSMLGLATKAGKTVSGEFSVEKALQTGKACLVIVADDASDNTKKKFTNKCEFYHVPVAFYSDKERLGKSMGKEQRSTMAFLDEGFANAVLQKMESESESCIPGNF